MQTHLDPDLIADRAGDRNHGLGPVLRDLRRSAGMTHAAVAAPMGLGRTSLCNIERGNQAITIEKLAAFADHLDIEVTISFKPKKGGRKKGVGSAAVVLSARDCGVKSGVRS
ncbi:helix-turn-helix domain-containing protein [Paucibacter soli]|uniref:helix-turn-helix domain-containing protein n=1 Tax=Paucibacter soli TaxID=3133433 RepID=UPI0030A2E2B3